MTRTTSIVPADYDELFRHYYPYVIGLVKRYKVHPAHTEDVAMTLLTKFIEKGMLEQYDPERVGANGKPIRFASFLSGFIVAYVRYYTEITWKEAHRTLHIVDTTVSNEAGEGQGEAYLDARGFTHEDDLSGIEYDLLVHNIRLYLARIPVKRKKNFLLLFDLVLDQIEERGRVHKRELAGLFSVSEALISSWMKELQEHVRQAQG